MQCRRRNATPAKQIMAPLPGLRTRMSFRAFSQTSVDFGGVFISKQGRGNTRQKRYLGLFTCLATRVTHLEVSFSLDTESFLNAFFRMLPQRGLPKDIVCDNGTNFVGGGNELKELEALDHKKIQGTTTRNGVKWHFSPHLPPVNSPGTTTSLKKISPFATASSTQSVSIKNSWRCELLSGQPVLTQKQPTSDSVASFKSCTCVKYGWLYFRGTVPSDWNSRQESLCSA